MDLPLRRTGPNTYAVDGLVPVGGYWKSMVFLGKGSILAAAPVTMPAEPDIRLAAIPLRPERRAPLASAQLLLMREAHGGSPAVAAAAYALCALTLLAWLMALGLGARRVARTHRIAGEAQTIAAAPRGHPAAA